MNSEPRLTATYSHRFQRTDADWLDLSGFAFDMLRWFRRWKHRGSKLGVQIQVAVPGGFCFDVDHGGRTRTKNGYSPAPGFERRQPEGGEPLGPRDPPALILELRQFKFPCLKLIMLQEARGLAHMARAELPEISIVAAEPVWIQGDLVIASDGSRFFAGRLNKAE